MLDFLCDRLDKRVVKKRVVEATLFLHVGNARKINSEMLVESRQLSFAPAGDVSMDIYAIDLMKMAQIEVAELRSQISDNLGPAVSGGHDTIVYCLRAIDAASKELDLQNTITAFTSPDNIGPIDAPLAAVRATLPGVIIDADNELNSKLDQRCRQDENVRDIYEEYRTVRWRVMYAVRHED